MALPTEVLSDIFCHLAPLSLISCSHAASQFSHIINRKTFLDRYCQRFLHCDWITWEMLLESRKSFLKVVEMWYLSAASACHPHLIVKGSDSLHALGVFVYTLNTWLIHNKEISATKRNQCVECHGTEFLRSVVCHSDAYQLLLQLAISVPKFINLTLMSNERFAFCKGKPYNLDFLLCSKFNDVLDAAFVDDFQCEHTLEIIMSDPSGELDTRLAAGLLVGRDSWIGWSGLVEQTALRYLETWECCRVATSEHFELTRRILEETFEPLINNADTSVDEIELNEWYCVSVKLLSTYLPPVKEPLCVTFGNMLEQSAHKIGTRVDKLNLQGDVITKLKQYLDGIHQIQSVKDTGKSSYVLCPLSKTTYVSILRYLHRTLNDIFFYEIMKYLCNRNCWQYLIHSREYKTSRVAKKFAQLHSKQVSQFHQSLSVTCIPPMFWPRHLLCHALTAIPTLSKLVQVDLVLWVKGIHDQPVSDKVRQFVHNQTTSGGLTWDNSGVVFPPLCSLVRYSRDQQVADNHYGQS